MTSKESGDARIKADEETIRKSLVGNWRAEHLFTLKQSREMFRNYQQQIVACDQEIEGLPGEFDCPYKKFGRT